MEIVPFQHKAIQRVFPNYDRDKSKIIWEFGNETCMTFGVHVYRKGRFQFEISRGEYKSHRKYA